MSQVPDGFRTGGLGLPTGGILLVLMRRLAAPAAQALCLMALASLPSSFAKAASDPDPRLALRPAPMAAPREVNDLVKAYFEASAYEPAGLAQRAAIRTRLDEISEPLTARQIGTWSKTITKLWKQGPKLSKKGGRQYWWKKQERGVYIVGGESKRPKGLFLGMHGGGVGSGDAGSAHGAFGGAADKFGWVAIFPEVLEKTELGWTDSGTEEFVMQLVEAARRTWKIDPDKVYFGGHSMGGYGSWTLGAHHADTVAALTPSAGAPSPYLGADGLANDIVDGVVPNLRNVPMVIYQSADDPRVPPDANRVAVKKLREAQQRWGGYDFEYWEVDGRGHDYAPGGNRALLEKVHERVRNPRPDKIVWQPDIAWKQHFYWLWWDEPLRHAIVVAERDVQGNAVHVTSEADVSGLEILLDEELLDVTRAVIVTLNGKETYRGVPVPHLSTLLKTGVRGDPRLTFAYRVPVSK